MTDSLTAKRVLVVAVVVSMAGCQPSASETGPAPSAGSEKTAAEKPLAESAIAEIGKVGGRVTRDEGSPDRPVIAVDFVSEAALTDAGWEHLKGLDQLQQLNLSYTRITDAGLAHLTGLPQLQTLNLRYTPVTDAGLVDRKSVV